MRKYNVTVQLLDSAQVVTFEAEAESSAKCYMEVVKKYWGTKIKIDVTTA